MLDVVSNVAVHCVSIDSCRSAFVVDVIVDTLIGFFDGGLERFDVEGDDILCSEICPDDLVFSGVETADVSMVELSIGNIRIMLILSYNDGR